VKSLRKTSWIQDNARESVELFSEGRELRLKILDLVAESRDFFSQGINTITGTGFRRQLLIARQGSRVGVWRRRRRIAKQMRITRFLGAGLPGKENYERRFAFGEALQSGVHAFKI